MKKVIVVLTLVILSFNSIGQVNAPKDKIVKSDSTSNVDNHPREKSKHSMFKTDVRRMLGTCLFAAIAVATIEVIKEVEINTEKQ